MPTSLTRRDALALGTAALVAPGLAAPAQAQGNAKVLRFVPHANLSTPDPLWSSALIAFDAAYMKDSHKWRRKVVNSQIGGLGGIVRTDKIVSLSSSVISTSSRCRKFLMQHRVSFIPDPAFC